MMVLLTQVRTVSVQAEQSSISIPFRRASNESSVLFGCFARFLAVSAWLPG